MFRTALLAVVIGVAGLVLALFGAPLGYVIITLSLFVATIAAREHGRRQSLRQGHVAPATMDLPPGGQKILFDADGSPCPTCRAPCHDVECAVLHERHAHRSPPQLPFR